MLASISIAQCMADQCRWGVVGVCRSNKICHSPRCCWNCINIAVTCLLQCIYSRCMPQCSLLLFGSGCCSLLLWHCCRSGSSRYRRSSGSGSSRFGFVSIWFYHCHGTHCSWQALHTAAIARWVDGSSTLTTWPRASQVGVHTHTVIHTQCPCCWQAAIVLCEQHSHLHTSLTGDGSTQVAR